MFLSRVVSSFIAVTSALALALLPGAPALAAGCDHVSKADVGKALGTPVSSVHALDRPGSENCTYRTADFIPSVIVSTSSADAGHESERFASVTGMSASLFQFKPVHVSGVGDEAVLITHILWVRKGRSIYSINAIVRGGAQHAVAVERAIAAKVHP
ncbi:MAG: hypothetical protein M3N19_10450 [Candidatus Eremiobacteraeota bacterium]|nr:hypothetical protein [Candidatus Eremiobacteraeota bacterium]